MLQLGIDPLVVRHLTRFSHNDTRTAGSLAVGLKGGGKRSFSCDARTSLHSKSAYVSNSLTGLEREQFQACKGVGLINRFQMMRRVPIGKTGYPVLVSLVVYTCRSFRADVHSSGQGAGDEQTKYSMLDKSLPAFTKG